MPGPLRLGAIVRVYLRRTLRFETIDTLFQTVNLFFYHLELDIKGLVKLHETIDVVSQLIDAFIDVGKLFVHFRPEVALPHIKEIQSPIDLLEVPVDLLETLVDPFETPVDLFEAPVDLFEALVDLFEALVDSIKTPVNLLKTFAHEFFNIRESGARARRLPGGFLFSHDVPSKTNEDSP